MTNGTGSKRSLLAVASATSALLFFFPPAWAAALVLGVVALAEIKQSGGTLRGRGLAWAGIILSAIWSAVLAALLLNAYLSARREAAEYFPPLPEESSDFSFDEDAARPGEAFEEESVIPAPAAPAAAAPPAETAPAPEPSATPPQQ